MKILKIEWSNINSLVGEFSIDFTHPSIANGELFSISGPTGSGKSSILDAIFFALYATTPRQKSSNGISTMYNEIMSVGCRECWARLTFESKGKRYEVSTRQHRTKPHRAKKEQTDSSMNDKKRPIFNQPERELCLLEYVNNRWRSKMIANRTRGAKGDTGVTQLVEKITGLNFENARGSFILSQGEFARFLQAGGKARAEILSTITGTQIYEKIGEVVAGKCNKLETQRASLQQRDILPAEDRKAMEQELAEREEQQKVKNQEATHYKEGMKWLESVAAAQEKLRQAEERDATARDKCRTFVEEGWEVKLQQGQAAKEIQPVYQRLLDHRKECDKLRKDLTESQEKLKQERHNVEQALEKRETVKKRYDSEMPVYKKQRDTILQRLLPLEEKLKQAQETLEEKQKETTAALETARAGGVDVKASDEEIERLRKEYEKTAARRKELIAYEGGSSALPLVKNHLAELVKAAKRVQGEPIEDIPTTEEVRKQKEHWEQRGKQLEASGTMEELEKSLSLLREVQQASGRYQNAQKTHQEAESQLKASRGKLQALPDLSEVEKEVKAAENDFARMKELHGLKLQLADLYDRFRNHEFECCPCCGAKEPGKRPASVEDDMLKTVQKRYKDLDKKRAELKKQRDEASAAEARAQGAEQAAAEQAKEARQELEKALTAAQMKEVPNHPENREREISETIAAWKKHATDGEALVKLAECAEKFEELINTLSPFCKVETRRFDDAQKAVAKLEKAATEFTRLQQAMQEQEKALAAAEKLNLQKKTELKHREELVKLAEEGLRKAKETSAHLAQARKDLWDPEETGQAAQARIERLISTLEQQVTTSTKKLNDAEGEEARCEERCKLLAENADASEKAVSAGEQELTIAIRENHLRDLGEFLSAREWMSMCDELVARKAALDKNRVDAAAQLGVYQKEVEGLRQQALTTKSAEQLRSELEAAEKAISFQEEKIREIIAKLKNDEEARAYNTSLAAQAADLDAQVEAWKQLADVIGTTRSREGFKLYAQQISFDVLIAAANQHLRNLSGRYTLRQKRDGKFGLEVIDHMVDDVAGRDSSNLSGGESFVVSLALALGLSHLTGGDTSFDTLFLDEGFGTLDSETLEQVLTCLDALRAEGKTIGIISHVRELHDRMPASGRLEVEPIPGTGRSVIKPHPAVTYHAA